MSGQRLTFSFDTCLGLGGFGEMYVARMTEPGGLTKRVAVKILKEDLRDAPEAVQRLRDEGRVLAVLDHPCILRALEMTFIQGRVALVTEYIEGLDLGRACRPNALIPAKIVFAVAAEVASALHCAWTTPSPETGKPLQLIHRDIKPDNIRIGTSGEVKVLDFGIARTTEIFRHAKTAQGALPFTPGYAPPEAFTMGFQGSASDMYALGVTIYRLLTGRRLHESQDLSAQVTVCCLEERYRPFLAERLSHVASIPGAEELLNAMLCYQPSSRPTAKVVEDRCRALAAALPGHGLVAWASAMTFPEPRHENGTLVGQTVQEDDTSIKPNRARVNPRDAYRNRNFAPAPPPVPDIFAIPDGPPPDPEPVTFDSKSTLDAYSLTHNPDAYAPEPPQAPPPRRQTRRGAPTPVQVARQTSTPAPARRRPVGHKPIPRSPFWPAVLILLTLVLFVGLGVAAVTLGIALAYFL